MLLEFISEMVQDRVILTFWPSVYTQSFPRFFQNLEMVYISSPEKDRFEVMTAVLLWLLFGVD